MVTMTSVAAALRALLSLIMNSNVNSKFRGNKWDKSSATEGDCCNCASCICAMTEVNVAMIGLLDSLPCTAASRVLRFKGVC